MKAEGLTVTPRAAGTTVTWKFAEEKVQKWSVFGFNVYRADAGTDRFQKINSDPQGGPTVEGGYRVWLYVDKTADEAKQYTYAVAPVNVFHTEFPTRTAAGYAPGAATRPAAAAPAPVLRELHQTPAKRVALSWTFDPRQEGSITGFVVERADLPSRTLKAISAALPPAARDFVDEAAKKNDESFVYRVTAVGPSGPVANSNQMIAVYLDLPVPPRPAGVQARFAKVNDRRFVHLTWAPKAAGDAVTQGYVLYADNDREGRVVRQSSVAPTREAEYFWEVTNMEDRTFTVAIAAVGRGGQEGLQAQTTCLAPGTVVATVNGLTATAGAAGGPVALRLESSPAGPRLRGFRVRADGVLLADERPSLPPPARGVLACSPPRRRRMRSRSWRCRATGPSRCPPGSPTRRSATSSAGPGGPVGCRPNGRRTTRSRSFASIGLRRRARKQGMSCPWTARNLAASIRRKSLPPPPAEYEFAPPAGQRS